MFEVQKPDNRKQAEWDLGAMKAVMWMCKRWVFDLPVYFMVSACDEAADDRFPAAPQPDDPSYHAGLLKGGMKAVMQSMMDLGRALGALQAAFRCVPSTTFRVCETTHA
jgi:hypothetical protein